LNAVDLTKLLIVCLLLRKREQTQWVAKQLVHQTSNVRLLLNNNKVPVQVLHFQA